nr:hypothetical protein [Tanacetum cinerariifolium]
DCDELNTAKIALMANLSHFGSDALAEEAVQNSTPSAQQDAWILSVIEQLRTQVMNCTKINMENKSVNDTLTAELERYKEKVKFLKEGKNVDFMHRVTISDSCEQSVEIDHPIPSNRPTIVEVPSELPKVSMVNTSLQKLKHHLAGFDVVVKERTTTTAITEGSWGFERIKTCFRDEIILFLKELKDMFNTFDQYLTDELTEVQNVFHQMEQAVDQHRLEYKTFGFQNERLLEQVINKDIVNIVVNASVNNASVTMSKCKKCFELENELLNKQDFIEKEKYDRLLSSYATLEKHCISLEVNTQLNQESFKRDNSISN